VHPAAAAICKKNYPSQRFQHILRPRAVRLAAAEIKNAAARLAAARKNTGAAMMKIKIPGFKDLSLKYLVLDYNGTIALDGTPLPGVKNLIRKLAQKLEIHILTADTHKNCAQHVAGLPVKVSVITAKPEDKAKLDYVKALGEKACVCIGNGMNDRLMLGICALGIAVMGAECAAVRSCSVADIVAPGIIQALELLLRPHRLLATLRL